MLKLECKTFFPLISLLIPVSFIYSSGIRLPLCGRSSVFVTGEIPSNFVANFEMIFTLILCSIYLPLIYHYLL